MQKEQPLLLEQALQYLVALEPRQLIALVLVVLREDVGLLHCQHEKAQDFADMELLSLANSTIVALEVMLYVYKLLLQKRKTGFSVTDVLSTVNYQEVIPEQVENYIVELHSTFQAWLQDNHRTKTIITLLTKVYQKQIIILEQLFQASVAATQKLANFSIILHSQIVSVKALAKKNDEHRKQLNNLTAQKNAKQKIEQAINHNRQQLNHAAKLEQFAVATLFPALMKKLKHDQAIFYSKHRFMAEEFKVFLHEYQSLSNPSSYSELAAANIYDLLKRVQHDIVEEIKFGRYHG